MEKRYRRVGGVDSPTRHATPRHARGGIRRADRGNAIRSNFTAPGFRVSTHFYFFIRYTTLVDSRSMRGMTAYNHTMNHTTLTVTGDLQTAEPAPMRDAYLANLQTLRVSFDWPNVNTFKFKPSKHASINRGDASVVSSRQTSERTERNGGRQTHERLQAGTMDKKVALILCLCLVVSVQAGLYRDGRRFYGK